MMADSSVRAKQTTSASFKAHCNTEKGRKEINAFLNGLLKLKERFDEHKKSWCLWLLAGGRTPEEFKNTVKSFDYPTICGLVWNKNFVAYRCRDCGISPCMSICADCFHGGNHEGHDFNMFKSQAGGACDCGDESVMAREGFCSRHGMETDTPKRKPPDELFSMVRIVMPQLCMRLYTQLDQVDKDALGSSSDILTDANELAEFLMGVCETDTMKNVVAKYLLMKISEMEAITRDKQYTSSTTRSVTFTRRFHLPSRTSHSEQVELREGIVSMDSESDNLYEDSSKIYLECMMDFVTKLEFPQKIVTFLLHLLPCKQYKESFTRVFCQNYQKIAKTLVSTTDTGPSVEQLASRVVHVSVQLYSNKHLAEKMVCEQNFLQVMIRVLHDMIKPSLKPVQRGQELSSQLVVNCDNRALKDHCYWPIVTDFINVLSHKSIAQAFMNDHDLIQKWIKFIQYLTGMNISQRQLLTHVEYESTIYCTSFSVELEAASSPLWSMVHACTALNSETCVRNVIASVIGALEWWYRDEAVIMPRRGEVTLHLPLHRYLAGFLSLAMSHFKTSISVPQTLLAQMAQHLLQIQAAVCEIRAGRWVRNGNQISSQVRLYVECHFCNSMVDLDIFMLQMCAANLDPDEFLDAILERFGIKHWFEFGPLAVPTPTCFDSDTDIAMVKGVLNLILTLLSSRLYLGLSDQEVIRQEMVTQLCIGDKTHSQLVELIPDKPGQSHKIQDFEKTLNELADYKAPTFESGWMQQGKYEPKDKIWENEFDPVHVFHRVVQRQDIQSAMSRYSAFINKGNQTSATLWPPFKPLKPLPKGCEGILRLLNCKTMHGMLFYIYHQASLDSSAIPDAVLYLAVHLTSLALQQSTLLPIPRAVQRKEVEDIGCQIAMRCIEHLELYGKHVKGLHQTEDLRHINTSLVAKLQENPLAGIDPQQFSCHEVCVVMAYAIHQIMQPPLFDPFLPFMARVLNSALTNRSNTHEKVAQLQYIQYLLELLPAHRQRLVKTLTHHLVSVSERYKIPTKNLVLVSDDTQPMELSMLLMYLIKYHDWLFRVRTPNPGWPRDIGCLDFKSVSMVDNIRHMVGIVTGQSEAMDTSDKDIGGSASQSSSSATLGALSEDADGPTIFKSLVQQFMAITEATEAVARSLLYKCQGNLEVAINMHLNMEDTIPDVIPYPSATPSSTQEGSREFPTASEPDPPTAINESILSLLLKIKAGCQGSSGLSSSPFGTCTYYINRLLSEAGGCSQHNRSALSSMDSSVVAEDAKAAGDEPDDSAAKASLRRQRARERQQKLLAEFASKQKSFMEQALKKDPEALDASMEVDSSTVTEVPETSYECVICGESSPSTEERPVGLVALLQPSAVLKHRSIRTGQSSTSQQAPVLQCETSTRSKLNAIMKLFSKDESLDASAAGCESGIHMQTCGHYLHVDCQQSYLRSLQEEEAAQLHQMHSFNPRNGDFTCPLCRQLGNCVLPEIPSRLTATRENLRPFSFPDHLKLHEEVIRKYRQNSMTRLTKSALNFSVLGASIKTVTEIASMLDDSCDGIKTDKLFTLIYRTLRTNLELEQVDKEARQLSAPRKSCFGPMFRAFQFHSQTLVGPMISVWSELTGIQIPRDSKSDNKPITVPVLLRDGPSLLIQIMLSWPTAISLQDFQCLVQVIYNLVFTQALVHSCCKFVGDERLSWQETGKKALLYEKTQKLLTIDMLLGFVAQTLSSSSLFKEDNQMLGISQSVWSPHMVEQSIRDLCLPYLKQCSLISSLCFDTELPTSENYDKEYLAYAASLRLHSEVALPGETFSCADCLNWPQHERPLAIIRRWCDSLSSVTRRCELFDKSQDLLPVTYRWPPPSLVDLPERYDTLIQHYRKQKCTKCDSKPDEPAICLVCGKFVCLQGTCCMSTVGDVRRYECVQHALECGAGTGVFLIILSSVIIIIRADRVCIWGSVYLDSFGEEDRDLRRGKPLFLSLDRFKRLQEQWFTHSFDHTCKRWKRHLSTL